MIGFVRRLLAWPPTWPAGDDGARIVRKGERGEPQDTYPLEELIRIVGETHVDESQRRADAGLRRTTARRQRPNVRVREAPPCEVTGLA